MFYCFHMVIVHLYYANEHDIVCKWTFDKLDNRKLFSSLHRDMFCVVCIP